MERSDSSISHNPLTNKIPLVAPLLASLLTAHGSGKRQKRSLRGS